jgi:hypothetical protein
MHCQPTRRARAEPSARGPWPRTRRAGRQPGAISDNAQPQLERTVEATVADKPQTTPRPQSEPQSRPHSARRLWHWSVGLVDCGNTGAIRAASAFFSTISPELFEDDDHHRGRGAISSAEKARRGTAADEGRCSQPPSSAWARLARPTLAPGCRVVDGAVDS